MITKSLPNYDNSSNVRINIWKIYQYMHCSQQFKHVILWIKDSIQAQIQHSMHSASKENIPSASTNQYLFEMLPYSFFQKTHECVILEAKRALNPPAHFCFLKKRLEPKINEKNTFQYCSNLFLCSAFLFFRKKSKSISFKQNGHINIKATPWSLHLYHSHTHTLNVHLKDHVCQNTYETQCIIILFCNIFISFLQSYSHILHEITTWSWSSMQVSYPVLPSLLPQWIISSMHNIIRLPSTTKWHPIHQVSMIHNRVHCSMTGSFN